MRGTEHMSAGLEKPLVAWSHSALKLYQTCPRKYYEAKITKQWPEIFKGAATEWGTTVHKAFEQRIKYGSPFPDSMSQWEPLAKKLAGMKGVILLEQQLALNKQMAKVGWFDKDVWVRVIIDYMCINQVTGNALLWDYKTGKRKDDDAQLALMAAVIFEIYPDIHKITAGFIWLKGEMSLYTVTFTRPNKGLLWNQHIPTVRAVENSVMTGHWPMKRSGLCNGWCPVEDCENWAPQQEK
jgi:hypothetical protein